MNRNLSYTASAILFLLSAGASAHDPKLHRQNAQKPDCAAMKDMDMSKMDMNDPVMKAMHEKCMGAAHGDAHGQQPADANEPAQPKAQPDEHGGH